MLRTTSGINLVVHHHQERKRERERQNKKQEEKEEEEEEEEEEGGQRGMGALQGFVGSPIQQKPANWTHLRIWRESSKSFALYMV